MPVTFYYKTHDLLRLYDEQNLLVPSSHTDFITGASQADNPKPNTILFFNSYQEKRISQIQQITDCLLLVNDLYRDKITKAQSILVFCKNPRFEYARIMQYMISNTPGQQPELQETNGAWIGKTAQIGPGTCIHPRAVIHDRVVIGKNCVIMSGAVINSNVQIGDGCIVRENAVIGGYGFGIDKDSQGNNFRLPHIGGVIIEDHVEIGALATVCSGTINPTLIGRYVKIDDHSHIGHNDIIGENSVITAGSVIGGSTKLGKNCWLGINCTVMNGLEIGDHVTIGMGTSVCNSINSNETVMPDRSETMNQKLQKMRGKKTDKE